jgi:hypothetical protein
MQTMHHADNALCRQCIMQIMHYADNASCSHRIMETMHHLHFVARVSYIDKGAEEEQMHEQHGKETHQDTET